jgi:hypothetical protein
VYTPIIGSKPFHEFLASLDRDLADQVRARRCRRCEGPLDASNYGRKPRGAPRDLPEACKKRHSLCCRIDGCRKRHKPPSIVFLDRRVYLGAVVVLIAALAEGATPRREKKLRAMIGASAPTIARWSAWWTDQFPVSVAWRKGQARFAERIDPVRLPRALLERWPGPLVGRIFGVLWLICGEHDP